MPSFKDLCGQTFCRWEVKSYAGKDKTGHSLWFCVCSCGEKRAVYGNSLTSGRSKSCGCLHRELNVLHPRHTTPRK